MPHSHPPQSSGLHWVSANGSGSWAAGQRVAGSGQLVDYFQGFEVVRRKKNAKFNEKSFINMAMNLIKTQQEQNIKTQRKRRRRKNAEKRRR